MEDPMFKQLSICAALLVITAGTANAQQKEAVLERMEVPRAAFDIIFAMPKAPIASYDLAKSPEALVMHLVGGELALGFDSEEKMLAALESMRMPVCAFHVESNDPPARNPVSVYIVPKGEKLTTAAK
jgi:hypothetical protein